MNWESDIKRVITFLVLVLLPFSMNAQDTPEFDDLKEKFQEGSLFKSEFTHIYRDTFTGESQVTEGVIWVGSDRYKIRNGQNLMVVDGEISRVYDNTKNRVIISDYVEEEDDFAPSRMLQGVDETYRIKEESLENNRIVIQLTSSDPFSVFTRVSIFLDESSVPTKIVAIDQVENELITEFIDGEFISHEEGIFEFQYPDEAEIIDLRHGS